MRYVRARDRRRSTQRRLLIFWVALFPLWLGDQLVDLPTWLSLPGAAVTLAWYVLLVVLLWQIARERREFWRRDVSDVDDP